MQNSKTRGFLSKNSQNYFMKKTALLLLAVLIALSGCLGYASTDWRNLFEKQQGEKIELVGYVGGAIGYPQQIFHEGEMRGYLLNAPWGKQTTGIPLILQEQINCDSNQVKIKGEIVKRGVQPIGSDFIELLDWMLVKVDSFECVP